VGLGVWLAVGSPRWSSAPSGPWVAAYAAFAIALWLATDSERAKRVRALLLAAQSALAVTLAILGMPHFEGALLALVAAQAAALVPLRTALLWSFAQAVPLAVIIFPTHGVEGTIKATGEYLAFSLFASLVGYLREREVIARRELAREHAALVATQSLLADGARSQERVRLAREVHDAIGHGLAAASVNLEIASRTRDEAAIEAARGAVKTTLGDLRGLVSAMRREPGVDLGLALRVLCAGVREPKVELRAPEHLELSDGVRAHALFRAVQEGLTNAMKHARATHVRVDVTLQDGVAIATIADDGAGARESAHKGSGLDGLRERVGELGGTASIESRPGEGFTLRVTLPAEAA
jgi:signal transduction histidine kinase